MKISSVKNRIQMTARKRQLKKNAHFIFSVNTGRSGSDYLGSLLGTADEVLAFHERQPYMIDTYLRMVEQKELSSTASDRKIKINRILKELAQSGKEVYAESNHMFGKTFFDVVFKNLENITVVHMTRDVKDTAKSFLKLRYFTPENESWDKWMIHPNSPQCFVKFPPLENEYELIFGYLAEMRFRSKYIKENFKANHIEVALGQLNDYDFVASLFQKIGITPTERTKELVGKKVNARHQRKKDFTYEFSQEKFDSAYQKINEIYHFED